MRRVVVTGMGVITPIGNSVDEFWEGIKDEKVGIAPISNFDTTEYKAKLSADVKGFDPKNYMERKILTGLGFPLDPELEALWVLSGNMIRCWQKDREESARSQHPWYWEIWLLRMYPYSLEFMENP